MMAESIFFSCLLSGRWENTLLDGSYFIDADPNLFEHILRYLRRGIAPVFYDSEKGHDYALYSALLEEARYFQIDRLEDWLESKRYLSAVTARYSATELEGVWNLSTDTDVDVQYYPTWGIKKTYICPRGICVHRGKPESCGRGCRRVQGGEEDKYDEEPIVRTLVIRRWLTFNREACLV
ncbi:uncharacterized protein K452DRAFT_345156 [Aplosporella prunicola CBS 121167]|uniref:Potassium channel tetramerisation-type BTB domain-containing protein n=1 Tax=Aplosporella prunicola CBS 121167 TaxID=1176127 RepID=A0A6A6AYH6_9PEZI|nr:uncharacterized protein K452DRAFT_345156 [Aplosporella prunicola CBS 121167]KAF2136044.1 hypothetical protein K452DRAFT_345156 [Aplosporella prunicola CBS 121167]